MSKSYIALDNCLYCGESKQIIMNKRLSNTLESGVYSLEPCDSCKEKFVNHCLVVEYNGKQPTGNWAAIPKEYIDKSLRENPVMFMTEKDFKELRDDNKKQSTAIQ